MEADNDFRVNLEHIVAANIQGVLPTAAQVAAKLQEAMRGKDLDPVIWSKETSSIRFHEIVERSMLTDSPPDSLPDVQRFWEKTKGMRHEAIERAPLDSDGGLRRGTVYNSLAADLGSSLDVIHNNQDIWNRVSDREKIQDARRLVKWVDYCYHHSQAQFLGLSPSLLAIDDFDIGFSLVLEGETTPAASAAYLHKVITIPSLRALLTIDPTRILNDVRNSDAGAAYFSALASWQANPTPESAEELIENLEAYALKLRALHLKHGRSVLKPLGHLSSSVGCGKSRWKTVWQESLPGITADVAGLIPGVTFFTLVGKLATATFRSLPDSSQDFISSKLDPGIIRVEIGQQRVSVVEARRTQFRTEASFN